MTLFFLFLSNTYNFRPVADPGFQDWMGKTVYFQHWVGQIHYNFILFSIFFIILLMIKDLEFIEWGGPHPIARL